MHDSNMMPGVLRDICDVKMMCMEEIAVHKDMNGMDPENARMLFYLSGAAEKMCKLVQMEQGGYSGNGYSGGDGSWKAMGQYSGGMSYGNGGGYSGAQRGTHYVHGHYSHDDGGYSGRGYSRDSGPMQGAIDELERKMRNASGDEKERLRMAIEALRAS